MARRVAPFSRLVCALLLLGATRPAAAAPGAPTPAEAAPVPIGAPAWIGVTMAALASQTGVRVEHVVRSGPAQRAGVQVGDVIVAVDATETTRPEHVTRAVTSRRPGDSLVLAIQRSGAVNRLTLVLASRPSSEEIVRMDLVGSPAPAFVGTTPLAGAPRSLAELRGRVVVLDFWASWCGPCRMVAPHLSALKGRLGAQGLRVVGVTTDEADRALLFAEQHQMRYPSLVDPSGATNRAYGIVGLPTMIVIDKAGVVRDVFVGFDPEEQEKMAALVKTLLAEAAPPDAKLAPAPIVPPSSVVRPDRDRGPGRR